MRLIRSSEATPKELEEILRELGAGDARFSGTTFGRGESSLAECLQELRDRESLEKTPPDLVPQTTYWLLDDDDAMVGIVRVRHRINEKLTQYGGHIGYYIRPAQRGHGYGTAALRLALERLREHGEPRALLTVNPANLPSTRVVLANGGVPDGQGANSTTGEVVDRYWIEL